jgi:hypothetical protein
MTEKLDILSPITKKEEGGKEEMLPLPLLQQHDTTAAVIHDSFNALSYRARLQSGHHQRTRLIDDDGTLEGGDFGDDGDHPVGAVAILPGGVAIPREPILASSLHNVAVTLIDGQKIESGEMRLGRPRVPEAPTDAMVTTVNVSEDKKNDLTPYCKTRTFWCVIIAVTIALGAGI